MPNLLLHPGTWSGKSFLQILCQLSRPWWVHIFTFPAVPKRHSFRIVIQNIWLTILSSLDTLQWCSLRLNRRICGVYTADSSAFSYSQYLVKFWVSVLITTTVNRSLSYKYYGTLVVVFSRNRTNRMFIYTAFMRVKVAYRLWSNWSYNGCLKRKRSRIYYLLSPWSWMS